MMGQNIFQTRKSIPRLPYLPLLNWSTVETCNYSYWSVQKVQTLIRPLNCLLFPMHALDTLLYYEDIADLT